MSRLLPLFMLLLPGLSFGQSFCGAFGFGYATTRPEPSGGWFCAVKVNSQLYSFTENQSQFVGKPVQIEVHTRTGFATPCKVLGKLTVFCIGTIGTGTAGGSVSLSTALGAIAVYPVKSWDIVGGVEVPWVTSPVPGQPSTARIVALGVAKSFGK